MQTFSNFPDLVLNWFDQFGRKDLPWQQNITAYRVWVSEIMLQQTQVVTVMGYFERFMAAFPTVQALAEAPLDQVLHLWSGLGYYSRAKNLHRAATIIVDEHNGELPETLDAMMALPGIGRSTAGAILSIAYQKPTAILDGNVKRVLARVFGIAGWPGKSAVLKTLWQVSEDHTPGFRTNHYSQAMMDLGATVCKRSQPDCVVCPVVKLCVAKKEGNIATYPGKKPKKVLPVKETLMVIFRHQQAVFLYRRPLSGIWPGLWSFPERSMGEDQDFHAWCLDEIGLQPEVLTPLSGFRHIFSHYHLDIRLVVADVNQKKQAPAGQDGLWYDPDMPQDIGLAAPVSKIIKCLKTESNILKVQPGLFIDDKTSILSEL